MPKLMSKAARADKDGAEGRAMVATHTGAKEQEPVVFFYFFILAFRVFSLPLFFCRVQVFQSSGIF